MEDLLFLEIQNILNKFLLSINSIYINLHNKSILCNRIAVSVSCGMDSLSLLILIKYFENHSFFIDKLFYIICVDHNLKEEDSIFHYLSQIFIQLKLNCNKYKIFLLKSGGNNKNTKEGFLRKIRFNLIKNFCINNNISYLFLAHHINDQQETFIMRTIRSSSFFGLKVMKKISFFEEIVLIRPLLNFSKQELKKIIKFFKLQKFIFFDKSNNNLEIERVFIRNMISERYKNIVNYEAQFNFYKEINEIYQFILSNISDIVTELNYGIFKINLNKFLKLNSAIQLFIFKFYIHKMSPTSNFRRRMFFEIIKMIDLKKEFKINFCNCFFLKTKHFILLFVEKFKRNFILIFLKPNTVFSIIWNNMFVITFYNGNDFDVSVFLFTSIHFYKKIHYFYPVLRINKNNVRYTINYLVK